MLSAMLSFAMLGVSGLIGSVAGSALVFLFFMFSPGQWGFTDRIGTVVFLEPLLFVVKVAGLIAFFRLVTSDNAFGESVHLPSLAATVVASTLAWVLALILKAKSSRQLLYDLSD